MVNVKNKSNNEKVGKGKKVSESSRKLVDKEFILFFSIFVVAIGILIGILLFLRSESEIETKGPITSNVTYDNIAAKAEEESRTEKTEENIAECLSRFKIDEDTVIFIYSDTCPYSIKMMDIVRDLEKNYKIYFANVNEKETAMLVISCLHEIAAYNATPEFVCPANKENLIGAVERYELEKFFESCRRG